MPGCGLFDLSGLGGPHLFRFRGLRSGGRGALIAFMIKQTVFMSVAAGAVALTGGAVSAAPPVDQCFDSVESVEYLDVLQKETKKLVDGVWGGWVPYGPALEDDGRARSGSLSEVWRYRYVVVGQVEVVSVLGVEVPCPTTTPVTTVVTTTVPTIPVSTVPVPVTDVPTTVADVPTTQAPTTQAPTTQAPTTQAPTTQAPTTQAPTTQVPLPPIDGPATVVTAAPLDPQFCIMPDGPVLYDYDPNGEGGLTNRTVSVCGPLPTFDGDTPLAAPVPVLSPDGPSGPLQADAGGEVAPVLPSTGGKLTAALWAFVFVAAGGLLVIVSRRSDTKTVEVV